MNDVIMLSKSYIQKYKKELFIGIGIFAVFTGAVWFYSYWRAQVEQAAYSDLFSLIQISQNAAKDDALWKTVEISSEAGFAQHSNSILAPYFLVMQAEALIRQERSAEALSVMNNCMHKLSSSSPFYYVYALKHALLQLSEEQTKNLGLKKLEELAYDKENPQRDAALYYLGNYYFLDNNTAQANTAWELLIAQFGQSMFGKSPWAELAQAKLGQLE